MNSFAVGDMANTGLDSGLDNARVRLRGAHHLSARQRSTRSSRASASTSRPSTSAAFELEGRGQLRPLAVAGLYGNYDAQPELGFLDRREGIPGSVTVKLKQNWSVLGVGPLRPRRRSSSTRPASGSAISTIASRLALNYITRLQLQRQHRRPTTGSCCRSSLRTLGGTSFSQATKRRQQAPAARSGGR